MELAETVQSSLSSGTFRLYSSPDPIGVEIGGSIKNVVAIGAGVSTDWAWVTMPWRH